MERKVSKLKVFIVPHWHFDALWQMTFEEYFIITLRNLVDLLEFLEVDPNYRFNIDQTIYIEEFLKRFPELSEKLKEAVKKGLIELVCSGYTQPDSNIPSGEFLVRNIVTYQKFVREVFGVEAKCGWFVDVYGQSGQLPQIFKKAKIDYFVFWRGVPRDIPSEFLWEGIDGTKILTHRMPLSYGSGYIPTGERRYYFFIETITTNSAIAYLETVLKELVKRAPTINILVPNGDDFTPPQRFITKIVREWRKRREDIEVQIATASQFFRSLEKFKSRLPTIKGEFNPILRGTYSARIEIKKENREVENLYLTAEKFATIASLFGYSYPREELDRALKLILTNQFHDAINGEVVDEVYDEIMDNFKLARSECERILKGSLNVIVAKIDTTSLEGIPIVIFNPLSWERTDIVEVSVAFSEPDVRGVKVVDWRGKQVLHQFTEVNKNPDGTLGVIKLIFTAENVPPIGYKVYYVIPTDEPNAGEEESNIKVSEEQGKYVMENQFYLIELDPLSKNIVRIYDKAAKREVIRCNGYLGNALFFEPDHGSVTHVNGELDPYLTAIPIKDPPNPEMSLSTMKCVSRGRIIERGPVRVTLSSYGVIENTKYIQYIMIYDKVKRIDFVTKLEFGDEHRRVRVVFPVNIEDGEIWHEIPYGAIKREEGEYPAINWVDISNKDYGVTLINRGIPGNSIVNGLMMLTLLRSIEAMYLASPFRGRLEMLSRIYLRWARRYFTYYALGPKALEKGTHLFKYALYPHEGTWRESKSYKVALEFNTPLIPVKTTKHKGMLPKEMSFLSLSPENLVLTVIKRADEGHEVVLRFYEAEGKVTDGILKMFRKIKRVSRTNLLEEEELALGCEGNEVLVKTKPFEIVTIKIVL